MAVTGNDDAILRVEDLAVTFRVRHGRAWGKKPLRAVNGVDLSLQRGRTLGLVGESGCGKTTLVRTILGLQRPTSGRVLLHGQDISAMSARELRRLRPKVQVVFQDPYSSLNPRMRVHDILAEPLRINHRYESKRIDELLEFVGMRPEAKKRFPSEFSGGQRQRIGIARALALDPEILILDEPVSALDVSIQAQVVTLLKRLQEELNLTCLLIAHDLSVVRHMSHEVAVMYLGKIVEQGTRKDIFETPRHPYTHSLMAAVPIPTPEGREQRRRGILPGDIPDPASPPSGCSFHTRCPRAQVSCAIEGPPLLPQEQTGHDAACWFAGPPGEPTRAPGGLESAVEL
jgi:oligopeptide/dipeptide ABC transporter ATP-binding protein